MIAPPPAAPRDGPLTKRRRLISARNRRKLADGLRRTAAAEQPPRRFDCCPVLADRVAGVRYELLLLADALEHSTDPDPSSVALIRELLTSGCSPLYNANVPAGALHATLARASTQLAPGPPADTAQPQRANQPTSNQHTPLATSQLITGAPTTTTSRGRSAPRRWCKHRADRRRHLLVKWLRRTANHTGPAHPIARRRQTLLHHRVGAVRSELLEIAAALEHNLDPNPTSLIGLHQLLANGCDSPLYNPDIHISELRATLHYLNKGLVAQDRRSGSTRPPRTTSESHNK